MELFFLKDFWFSLTVYFLVISFYQWKINDTSDFEYFVEQNMEFNFKETKNNYTKKIWVDIWEVNTKLNSLEKINDLSWNLYYKYKLSMLNTWHILEDRIFIFIIIIIFLIM